MSFTKKILLGISFVTLSCCLMVTETKAAGFQLGEQSVVGLGRSFAGAGIVGDDLSAIAYNPAGMSLADGLRVQVGGINVNIASKLHGNYTNVLGVTTPNSSTKIKENVVVPNFFLTYQLADDWTVGLGVFAGYGFDVGYNSDWFGKTHAIDSSLEAMNINPSVAYKINDAWSIGFGVSAERVTARLTSARPITNDLVKLKASDWAYGYNFGIMYQPQESTRIGLSYRSKNKHHLSGHALIGNVFANGVYTDLELPDYAIFSAYHKVNKWLGISGTARWTQWSSFKELDIKKSDGSAFSSTLENWKDTWFFGLGADLYLTDNLTIRGGWGYDSSPIKSAKYRTARIPDNYRYLLSCGVSYKYSDSLTFDAGYMHIFLDNSTIDNQAVYAGGLTDRLTAVYKSEMNLFGLQMQYKF